MKITEHERLAAATMLNFLTGDPELRRLFTVGPVRVFIKHLRSASFSEPRDPVAEGTWYFLEHEDDLVHIVDWLSTSLREGSAWLSNLDNLGRPKKLMKSGDLAGLVHEADKAMNHHQQQSPHFLSLSSKDERYERDLGAGYTLVRMLSPDALDVESDRMHHCLGHGSYDEDLTFGTSAFYSVRDQDGAPRATLEIVGREVDGNLYGHIKQFRGRRNADPEAHVVDLVGGIKTAMRWIDGPRTKSSAPEMATDEDLARAFLVGRNLR